MKDFLSLCHERYSVRSLSGREVEAEKIEKILEAGISAPTAVNRQPAKIWVFKSEESRKKLASTAKFEFVSQAPVVFAVGADEDSAWVRPFDNKNFADVDASIIATQMMLEIHELGLGSTWVGFFDEAALKELFPELKGYNLIALFPVGYPAEDGVPSQRHTLRKSREEMVFEF
ncbi:MAG: nitroreductase family protein [Clostridia bacterium]|nr:nitroreductase family protein [Clostridia bacterium]